MEPRRVEAFVASLTHVPFVVFGEQSSGDLPSSSDIANLSGTLTTYPTVEALSAELYGKMPVDEHAHGKQGLLQLWQKLTPLLVAGVEKSVDRELVGLVSKRSVSLMARGYHILFSASAGVTLDV
eukprot:6233788-Lingulodinium_polyedra.AAC.1